jgi:hypothetical protein
VQSSAVGDLPEEPTDGICNNVGEISEAVREDGARFKFSELRFLVTPRAPGSQFQSKLAYTDPAGTCTANYNVRAVWPYISCAGGPEHDTLDQTLCDPGAPFVNSDFALKCIDAMDTLEDFICVPAKDVPSYL